MIDLEEQLSTALHRYAESVQPSPPEPRAAMVAFDAAPRATVARRRVMLAAAAVVLLIGGLVAWTAGRDADGPDVPPAPPTKAGWTTVAPAPVPVRTRASVVWTGKEFIVWGGDRTRPSPTDPLVDGAAFNPSTRRWRPIASHPFSTFHTRAVWTGSRMVVLALNGGAAYDPTTDRWTDLPSIARVGVAPMQFNDLVVLDGTIVAYGFQQGGSVASVTGADPNTTAAQVWSLAPGDSAWVTAGPRTFDDDGVYTFGRRNPLIATDDGFIVWGGTDGYRYSIGHSWERLPALPAVRPETGTDSQAAWVDGRLVAVAASPNSPDLEISTLTDAGWSPLQHLEGVTRLAYRLTVAGSQVVMTGFGGSTNVPILVDPTNATTRAMDGFPLHTIGGQAVAWSGSQLLVWGGQEVGSSIGPDGSVVLAQPTFDDAFTNTGAIWTP